MHQFLAPSHVGISRAVDVLCHCRVVAFPTETVYGLGGNAYEEKSVSEIFLCKCRPESKPLSICYSSLQKALDDVEISDSVLFLAEIFLPGPITFILKRRSSSRLSYLCSAGLETIGVRVPSNKIALDLLSRLPFPLAAPSANKSSYPNPVTAQQVSDSLRNYENLVILDGGKCSIGTASTIIDIPNNRITRLGAISAEEIQKKSGLSFAFKL